MKHLKSLAIVVVLFMSAQSFAQTKIAHIDVQALMTNMPQMKTAQGQLEKVKEQYDATYNSMVTEYQTKLKKYEQEAPTVGEAVNGTRSQEMQDMGKRIQTYQQTATKELEQKEMDLLKPILEKAQAAIAKVAKAKGFTYVLDATMGAGVLVADGPNLLDDVKKELGF